MNQETRNDPSQIVLSDNGGVVREPDILDYIAILLKWRRFILTVTGIAFVVALVISFLIPKEFEATVSLMPPKDANGGSPFSSATSLLKGLGASRLGGFSSSLGSYNYIAILDSRTAREDVVRHFDLMTVYKIKDSVMEDAIRRLDDNVSIDVQKDDYITIKVRDEDPQRAADMANYFVEVLNSISNRLGTQEAHNNRQFIGDRLDEVRGTLTAAEDSLRSMQERRGLMISPEQAEAASAIATLYAMKAKKEVELSILRKNVDANDPAIRQAEVELNVLDRKVASFPSAGLEAARLFRAVMIQEKILEFLVPVYEQAKIDEGKNIPVILVLDKAVRPERKVWPKRSLIVLAVVVVSLLVSVSVVLLRERLAVINETDPVTFARLVRIRSLLFGNRRR